MADAPVIDPPATEPRQPQPDGPSTPEARTIFLADRDVPCPRCRYNLRGVTAGACPECGEVIELQLGGSRRHWVPPVFMALAFGWLLIAGTMNATRDGRYAWEAAHSSVPFSIGVLSGPNGGTSGSIALEQQSIDFATATAVQPGPTATFTPNWPGLAWSNVAMEIWIRLSWSLFLALAGLLGLIILWRHRRRPLSARAWARARIFALLAFGIYGGFHIYWFVLEVF